MTDKVTASDRYSDAQVTDQSICEHCGESITRAKTGPPPKYCSRLCRRQAQRLRDRVRKDGHLEPNAVQTRKSLDTYMAYVRASAQRQRMRTAVRI